MAIDNEIHVMTFCVWNEKILSSFFKGKETTVVQNIRNKTSILTQGKESLLFLSCYACSRSCTFFSFIANSSKYLFLCFEVLQFFTTHFILFLCFVFIRSKHAPTSLDQRGLWQLKFLLQTT